MTTTKVKAAPRKNDVGVVLKDPNGAMWVVMNAGSYEASAHNDRWIEHYVSLTQLTKRGTLRSTGRKNFSLSNLYDWTVVGTATFEVKAITFLDESHG